MDLSSKKVTWISHPFPHAIIDNFFPEGVNSFKASKLFRKTTLSYLINYIIYMILKFKFLSYLRYLYLEMKTKKAIQT